MLHIQKCRRYLEFTTAIKEEKQTNRKGTTQMKRKTLLTLLILTISATLLSGCKASDSIDKTETTAIESEATEQTEPTEQETEIFGLDDIDNTSSSEDKTTSSETSGTTRTDYPDSNTSHQKAWNNFCENWNESDYGTTTAGKCENDFPYYGDTGYDPKGTILQYRTTDKGYTVMYDTETGRVYYTGMTLPTGNSWIERESGSAAVITQYIIDNNLTGIYDITYAQFQELLGTYAGD